MLFRRDPPSDAQLVQAVLRGDKQKYAALVDRSHAAREKALHSFAVTEPEAPEHPYEQEEEERIVWEVVSRLPDELREVVLLFYIEDYSREQVARFLEVSVEAVRSRLRRARERLRGDLESALENKARDAIRRQRRGKEFTRKAMAGLPLALWMVPRPPVFWERIGWGVHASITGLLGIGLLGLVAGWWPPPERPHQGYGSGSSMAYVRLASTDEYLHFLDRARFPLRLEDTPSIFGAAPLGPEAVRQQQLALRGGLDGRLEWTFDSGPEGWRARAVDYTQQRRPLLPVEVRDGVLHIDLPAVSEGRVQTVELVSPELGYDCRLFGEVEARVRIIHDRPQPGGLHVHWTTPRNRLFPSEDPAWWQPIEERQVPSGTRFRNWRHEGVTYTGQWQDLVLDDVTARPETGNGTSRGERPALSWEGPLVDLRLGFLLDQPGPDADPNPPSRPRRLEIDRIVLRGSGWGSVDLPPPPASSAEGKGRWLDDGRFYPLNQRGLEHPRLGDLDGDGDPDLLITYQWRHPLGDGRTTGWIAAYNDGKGRFASGVPHEVAGGGLMRLDAVDVNGDGLVDVIRGDRADTVWVKPNRGDGQFAEGLVWAGEYLVGAADVDGDGDVDVVTRGRAGSDAPTARWSTRLWANHGDMDFRATELPTAELEGRCSQQAVADYDGDGRAELVRTHRWTGGPAQARVTVLSEYDGHGWQRRTEIPFEVPAVTQTHRLYSGIAYVGDIDRNGNWDIGTPLGIFWSDAGEYATALGVGVHSADHREPRAWLPRKTHLAQSLTRQPMVQPQLQDLDGDGLADPVFVDLNYRRGPCVMVMQGRPRRLPTQEGRYLLPGWPRGWVCGDVDGDDRVDVVVVMESAWASGVYVLRNVVAGRGALLGLATER